jgi:hypothetical protein
MPMRLVVRSFMAISVALSLVLTNSTFAYADSRTITFENPPYTPGSIYPQDGWAGTAGGPIAGADQAIVPNTYGYPTFGAQSWRFSNAYADGSFGNWPFSPSLVNEAGESMAQSSPLSGGIRQRHFEVQWDFATTVKGMEQPGLQMSTAPDRGDGARMSFIKMKDLPGGLSVDFADYQDRAPYGSPGSPLTAAAGCGPEDDFITTTVASGLSRYRPHTIRLTMDFKDGPRNDVVKVFVDGVLRHTGTSWEDYYRWCGESGGGTGTATDQSRTVDSMIFQARIGSGIAPATLGKGFLIDNLSYASSPGECRRGDGDGDFEDKDGHKHHSSFHHNDCDNRGGDVSDDDRDSGKHFQSTSTNSATYTSSADSTTLTMIGMGLDDGIPVGFTMVAVDYGGLAPAIYSLTLTSGRTFTGTLVSGILQLQ